MIRAIALLALGASQSWAGNKLGTAHDEDGQSLKGLAACPETGDTAMIRGVLWAFEPAPTEIRVLAAEDLGLLGDPRALNALAQLVGDANPAVQVAALRSVAAIRSPRSEDILANVVRHPTLPEKLKLQAVQSMLFQNTRSSLLFLHLVARSPQFTNALQNTARRVLQDTTPEAMGKVTAP